MKKTIVLLAAALLCAVGLPARAEEGKAPWEEYDKLIDSRKTIAAYGPTLFGDSVDLQSGALSFSTTDVSIPGNSKLPVAFARKFAVSNRKGYHVHDLPMADWDLDVPRLSGVFAPTWPAQRCTIATPPVIFRGDKYFQADDYWQGNQADLPGGGKMLRVIGGNAVPATGGPYLWMTGGNTYFSCLPGPIKNDSGEGFLAITADGTKYWFDWLAQYVEPTLEDKMQNGQPIYVARRKNVLYATRVEDRFGNWVTYTYTNGATGTARLTSINSNDGRQITVDYNANGQIASVSDGAHTWTYQYSYPTSTTGTLTAVIQPDNSRWTIDFAALADATFRYQKPTDPTEPYRDCFNPGDAVDDLSVTGTITHPSGAVGQFTVAVERHGRSNVPALCGNYSLPGNNPNDDVAYYPINWDSYSLTSKTVSGPGLVPATWSYAYGSAVSWFFPPSGGGLPVCGDSAGCKQPACTSDACAGTDVTVVAGPDGHYTRYTFGNSYRYNEGKLLKTEEGSSASSILRTTTQTYNLAQSGQPYPTPIGNDPQSRGDGFTSEYIRPQISATVAQQGETFASTVDVVNSLRAFDGFARPTSVTKASSLGYSKTETTEYFDDLSLWVLGQTLRTTTKDNKAGTAAVEVGRTQFGWKALPWKTYAFGKLQNVFSYDTTDGTLKSVSDGRDNASFDTTVTLSNWKRGIPGLVKYPPTPEAPAGATQSASIDNYGLINYVIDETGAKTCYAYDSMGRITSITYSSETTLGACDANTWNATTQAFAQIASSEYGIDAGHWRQIVTTGSGQKVNYFDALWRPLITRERDLNDNATIRFNVKAYDASGRTVFEAYPSTSATPTTGTRTVYDALDRVIQVRQDSELGTLVTTTDYLDGFLRRTTNARNKVTTESFQAFDTPSFDAPTQIAMPEGVATGIQRDVFGKPEQLLRVGPAN